MSCSVGFYFEGVLFGYATVVLLFLNVCVCPFLCTSL